MPSWNKSLTELVLTQISPHDVPGPQWVNTNSVKIRMLYLEHYSDGIMSAMASQITGVSTVCLKVFPCADQRKHQSSASLAFVRGIHRWRVDSPRKGPVTRKMFPFVDVIMKMRLTFPTAGPSLWQAVNHLNHYRIVMDTTTEPNAKTFISVLLFVYITKHVCFMIHVFSM